MADWRTFIEPSLFQGTHLIDDVDAAVRAGEMQLWATETAAAITEIVEYPRKKALHMPFCGGELGELVNVIVPACEAWGKAQGCDWFTGCGRAGWDRVMGAHGYRKIGHFWAKEA